jgi:hypothetical protein
LADSYRFWPKLHYLRGGKIRLFWNHRKQFTLGPFFVNPCRTLAFVPACQNSFKQGLVSARSASFDAMEFTIGPSRSVSLNVYGNPSALRFSLPVHRPDRKGQDCSLYKTNYNQPFGESSDLPLYVYIFLGIGCGGLMGGSAFLFDDHRNAGIGMFCIGISAFFVSAPASCFATLFSGEPCAKIIHTVATATRKNLMAGKLYAKTT